MIYSTGKFVFGTTLMSFPFDFLSNWFCFFFHPIFSLKWFSFLQNHVDEVTQMFQLQMSFFFHFENEITRPIWWMLAIDEYQLLSPTSLLKENFENWVKFSRFWISKTDFSRGIPKIVCFCMKIRVTINCIRITCVQTTWRVKKISFSTFCEQQSTPWKNSEFHFFLL